MSDNTWLIVGVLILALAPTVILGFMLDSLREIERDIRGLKNR